MPGDVGAGLRAACFVRSRPGSHRSAGEAPGGSPQTVPAQVGDPLLRQLVAGLTHRVPARANASCGAERRRTGLVMPGMDEPRPDGRGSELSRGEVQR